LANLEYQIPITDTSVFNVASISKQFTAASIAILLMDGEITLNDKISDYIEEVPDWAEDIEIRHLVYMTSGINDYYYNPRANGLDWSSLHFFNIDTAIAASFGSGELMYEPENGWSYSNINYMLMTKIVENVAGIPFSQFSEQRIFEPLGMDQTVVNDDIFQVIPNRASAYNFRDEESTSGLLENGYLSHKGAGDFLQINRNSPHHGGSGIFTSIQDLVKWQMNFQTRKFGGQEFYDWMHRTEKFQHDKSNDAFGLVWGDYNGQAMVWYEGGDWGVSSYMIRFPDQHISVIVLANYGTARARDHAFEVIDILFDQGFFGEN